jgi:hypothetical protein
MHAGLLAPMQEVIATPKVAEPIREAIERHLAKEAGGCACGHRRVRSA